MLIDLDPATALHVGIAVRQHIRELQRDGVRPSRELLELAGELDPARLRDRQRDRLERQRELARARKRRSRARRRLELAGSASGDDCRVPAAG